MDEKNEVYYLFAELSRINKKWKATKRTDFENDDCAILEFKKVNPSLETEKIVLVKIYKDGKKEIIFTIKTK